MRPHCARQQPQLPAAASTRTRPTRPSPRSPRPALGANASPEVTHRYCRLPLVTLLHRLEAVHLGVRMRFLGTARPSGKKVDRRWGFRKNSHGSSSGTRGCAAIPSGSGAGRHLKRDSRRPQRQREKRTLPRRGYPGTHRGHLLCSLCSPQTRFRNLRRIPFPPLSQSGRAKLAPPTAPDPSKEAFLGG